MPAPFRETADLSTTPRSGPTYAGTRGTRPVPFEFAMVAEVYCEVVGAEGMLFAVTPPVSAVASSTVVGGVLLRESGRLLP